MLVSPKPLTCYPWYLRWMFARQRRVCGKPLDATLLWGRRPALFLRILLLYRRIDGKSSPLDTALRSLLMVRISQINHCTFCVDINTSTLLERHVLPEKALNVSEWRSSALFSPQEQVALEFAEAVTLPNWRVDKATVADLPRYYGEDGIVELAALVAFQNMSSKFNSALDVPSQGFCDLTRGDNVITNECEVVPPRRRKQHAPKL